MTEERKVKWKGCCRGEGGSKEQKKGVREIVWFCHGEGRRMVVVGRKGGLDF